MQKLRIIFAILIGKFSGLFIKAFSKRGTNLPGKIALKICPDLLLRLKMPPLVIAVTGTNGKTSTSNMTAHILRQAGKRVVNNPEGSNMEAGVLAALLLKTNIKGVVKADAAVLEIDERSSPYIFKHLTPNFLICTNLFRDSIKRNGHSEFIFDKIDKYLPPETVLILNGNDGISGQLGSKNKRIYFAVARTEKSETEQKSRACDFLSCTNCHSPIEYEFYHYHHIGKPFCKCGFALPAPSFLAQNVDFDAGTFDLCDIENGQAEKLCFPDGSLINAFNMTAAASVCLVAGVDIKTAAAALNDYGKTPGRFDLVEKDGLNIISMLSKNQNPISCSRSFAFSQDVAGDKTIVLLVTDSKDKKHGHEDISWLYDADFERLNDDSVKRIIAAGTRADDVGLRLILAGIKTDIITVSKTYDGLEKLINISKDAPHTVFIFYELYALPIAKQLVNKLM